MTQVHPSAVVSPKAQLAENVVIDAHCIVEDDVTIDAGSHISSSVRICSGSRLGKNLRIFHGASIGDEPQDLKYAGEKTELFIGDNTMVREFCTLHRGTTATRRTVVGSDCMLMAYTHIAHDCIVGNHVILANGVQLAGHVEIEDFAILGGILPVHQFVRIGRHAMVGGGLRIPKDIPPYILVGGYPARYYGLNSIGLRRRGFSAETRSILKRAYALLFQSKFNTQQAVKEIQSEFGNIEEVKHILDFVSKSKRGLLPGNHSRLVENDD
jgi:UDP-N-acetylglucosamine acyltransferase